MEIIKPNYYDNFSCLVGSCPDTCCAHWEVVIDEKALRYYDTVEGEIGNLIRNAITQIDGDICFGLHDGNCRMLRPDGLCEIQRELGHDALCKSCALFPRFITEVGLRREIGISISCPEAARLILTSGEPFALYREVTEEPMTALHDISPARIIAARTLCADALKLSQDGTLSFPGRCHAVASLAASVMGKKYPVPSVASAGPGGLERFREALHHTIARLEPLQPEFQQRLLHSLTIPLGGCNWDAPLPECPMLWQQLLIYGIYKYIPRAMFDGAIWPAVVFGLMLPLLLRQLIRAEGVQDLNALLRLAWSLSRELEHSEENMVSLWQSFSHRDFRPAVIRSVYLAMEP